jgi:hypothetical protein
MYHAIYHSIYLSLDLSINQSINQSISIYIYRSLYDTHPHLLLRHTSRNFRHLPVVDSKTFEIMGVLSIKDIVRAISGETKTSRGFWLFELFKKKSKRTSDLDTATAAVDEHVPQATSTTSSEDVHAMKP